MCIYIVDETNTHGEDCTCVGVIKTSGLLLVLCCEHGGVGLMGLKPNP